MVEASDARSGRREAARLVETGDPFVIVTDLGLPSLGGSGRGDQLVRIYIEVPEKLNDRQKELLREFGELETERSGDTSFFEKIVNHFK